MASVLVIDDDDVVRSMLLHILTRNGHEAAGARDGEEGIARFQRNPADLVITDIFMPNQEGLATIMALRRNRPDLRIIAISGGGARASLDVLPVAEALGAQKTLRKPFKPAEILEAVRVVLGG
ncbi:response regulator transcription factor [Azospirillum agricola]|uniref:response regulator transcription factor n=1 Tax=Azospirillum agricola TaxID=1720247 RepID=UPI000A0EF6AE|nr:response regulator [Azospirillum agricola]MBP2231576.1 CheY-like chemotaxis protein [Azospirillum agricola]SMH43749.1 Response regulator receiver domain-containing protein [Azospirillum lipoferum]